MVNLIPRCALILTQKVAGQRRAVRQGAQSPKDRSSPSAGSSPATGFWDRAVRRGNDRGGRLTDRRQPETSPDPAGLPGGPECAG
jgi:hypothetical protein